MAKIKETFTQVFEKAFYGKKKQHLSNSYLKNGKIVVQTFCGRSSVKFLVSAKSDPNHRTCKNCLKVAQSQK